MEQSPTEDNTDLSETAPEPEAPEMTESAEPSPAMDQSAPDAEAPELTESAEPSPDMDQSAPDAVSEDSGDTAPTSPATAPATGASAAASGAAKWKVVASMVGGALILTVGGGALLSIPTGEAEVGGGSVRAGTDPGATTGFVLGDLSATEPVERILVTLQTGAEGADLTERVDLHLGTGFPLRLFPLGNDSRDPAFAAYPQASSLDPGQTNLPAGEGATFTFAVSGEEGQDVLRTSPQLLKDLTVGDLKVIGFSSLGESAWILEGYRIEVNGKLFAEHDSVNAQPGVILGLVRRELAALKPESEVLLTEISALKSLIASGLGSDRDKSDLAEKEALLEKISLPLNRLAGQGAGYLPWYVEKDAKFTPAASVASGNPVAEVGVKLTAGGGDQPGTRNPLYLKAGGKKFLLTSEIDPLANLEEPQDFVISLSDLESNPIKREDLERIGIGLIGNEERFGLVPDRAKLQRVVVTVDGEEVYDSDTETTDRRALQALWLVPPVHFDDAGAAVRNEEKPREKHLWVAGMEVPAEPPSTILPEPLPPPFTGLAGIGGSAPGALPGLLGTTPAAPPGLSGIGGPGTAGTPPPLTGATPGAPPGLSGIGGPVTGTPPPLTGATPGTPPPLTPSGGLGQTGTAPGFPSGGTGPTAPGGLNPGRLPGAPPTLNPQTGGGSGAGSGPNPGVRTAITGPIAGSFVPSGVVDPATGLVRGNFQRTNSPGFTPIRSGGPGGQLGGINPAVFNQPTTPGRNPRALSQADIAQLATAILNVLKLTPATPTPQNPTPPPTISAAGFPNTAGAVEIGRKTTVDWTVLGDAGGMGQIVRFRIDLMPVLPHLSPPTPSGATPLATTSVDANSRTVSVPPIQMPAGGFPGVAKTDHPLLYVKPVVTALDADGKTIGTAKEGAILPLLPDPLTYQHQLHSVRFSLQRGLTALPTDDPTSQLGGSFQIIPPTATPPTAAPNSSWKVLTIAKPGSGLSDTAAMIGFAPENAVEGLTFAPTEVAAPAFAFHTAARTRGGNTAVLIYEGGITYPAQRGTPVAAGTTGTLRGYRLVGHLGFLADSAGGPGTAQVQMRVELSGDGKSFAPVIVRNLNGDHVVDQNLEKSAWFRLETSAPIAVKQVPGEAMQEFDIPISFEALDKGVGSVYPASRPAASFGSVPKGSNFATPANHLTAPMAKVDFDAYEAAKKNGASYGVTVTIMVDTSATPVNDTLGIFGLRLVPDVY